MPASPPSNPDPERDTEGINLENSAQKTEPGIPGELKKESTPLPVKEVIS